MPLASRPWSHASRPPRTARRPRRELLRPVAGEHEVRVAVDEAGDHAAPAGVDALVPLRPGPLDRDNHAVLDHERRIAHLAELVVVRHEQPNVVYNANQGP